jgi:hypothetical protein
VDTTADDQNFIVLSTTEFARQKLIEEVDYGT